MPTRVAAVFPAQYFGYTSVELDWIAAVSLSRGAFLGQQGIQTFLELYCCCTSFWWVSGLHCCSSSRPARNEAAHDADGQAILSSVCIVQLLHWVLRLYVLSWLCYLSNSGYSWFLCRVELRCRRLRVLITMEYLVSAVALVFRWLRWPPPLWIGCANQWALLYTHSLLGKPCVCSRQVRTLVA